MNLLPWLLSIALLLAGLIPVWWYVRSARRAALAVAGAAIGVFVIAGIALTSIDPPSAAREETERSWRTLRTLQTPQTVREGEFVSSSACRACHPRHYDSWHDTYHRTMTQWATEDTVLAPFANVELKLDTQTYRLSRQGDEFWAEMPDPVFEVARGRQGERLDARLAPTVRRRVVMTTGSHHLQHYWVAASNGQGLMNFPWEYHIAEKRWIPMMDAHVVPPEEKRTVSQWNSTCITCHSVGGVPGLDQTTGKMSTQVAEIGIACEACHGPGEQHVRHHRNPVNRYGRRMTDEPDRTIINPARCSPKVSASICGQCHSTFHMIKRNGEAGYQEYLVRGTEYRAGDDLARSIRLLSPHQPGASLPNASLPKTDLKPPFRNLYWNENDVRHAYWSDGAARVGGREYLGLMGTACFVNGEMSCLSCHSMHNSEPRGQVAPNKNGNQSCLQCHSSIGADIKAHTHHEPTSTGSQCYNCHMPHTSFALLRAIRSHRIDSPRASPITGGVKPNACNLCHLDKTMAWTARNLSQWYGHEEPVLSDEEQRTAASVLWLLRGDAAQRAVTAWHTGHQDAQQASDALAWSPPLLSVLLDDPYSVVRYVAGRALRNQPQFESLEYDYIGSPDHRAEVRERVVETWRRDREGGVSAKAPHVLLEEEGLIDQRQINDLLNRRDDRPVKILE